MFLEVEHDHCKSVLSALKLSFSSSICDKICLVSESGDKFCTNFSFISIFSKLISSITRSSQHGIHELIFVPMKLTTIENLMILLSEGKLISNNMETLKDVFEAAKTFDIESQSWSIDIEEKDELTSPASENCDSVLVQSISEPVAKHGFSDLEWADCEIGNKANESEIDEKETEIKKEVEEIKNISEQSFLNCQVDILNITSQAVSRVNPKKRGRPKKNENTVLVWCPECPRSFMFTSQLALHYASTHTGGNSFNCGKCQKRFKSKYGLQYHVMSFHEEPTEVNDSCNVCGDIIVGSGKTEYTSRLSAKLKMKNHMRIVHGENEEIMMCFICNKKFIHKYQFSKHMLKAHTNSSGIAKIKPFQCSQPGCERKYFHESSKLFHEKTHDPDNLKFPCKFCDLKFINLSRLLLHQEVHIPWRECADCGETLNSKRKFDIHIQQCRNELKFPCEICGNKFSEKDKLDRHIKIHLKVKSFSCDKCGKQFSRKASLQYHRRRQVCKKGKNFKAHMFVTS